MLTTEQMDWLKVVGGLLLTVCAYLAKPNPRLRAILERLLGKGNSMNYLVLAMKALQLASFAVVGVEKIHAEKDSASKKQMAQDALQIAAQAYESVDPGHAGLADAVATEGSNMIENAVSLANLIGMFTHKKAKPAPAPFALPTAAVLAVAAPAVPAAAPAENTGLVPAAVAVQTSAGLHTVTPA